MHLKQTIKIIFDRVRNLNRWIKISVSLLSVALIIGLVILFQAEPVQFSYSQSTCVSQITLFPDIYRQTGDDSGFDISHENVTKIGSLPILSLKTCFSAKKAPTAGNTKVSVAMFGGWFAKRSFDISIPHPPSVKVDILDVPVPTSKPIFINLSNNDLVFNYQLEIDGKTVSCPIKQATITCDITPLHLLQGQKYDIKIDRMFSNKKVETIASRSITMLNAVSVVSTSITSNQIIYDKPKTFTVTFDKDISSGSVVIEKIVNDQRTTILSTTEFKDKQATVSIADDLARSTNYEATIDKIVAKDNSSLVDPYKIDFSTSDGPAVTDVNVDNYGLPVSKTIVLTFDSKLSDDQDINQFITVSGVSAVIVKSGDQVLIGYTDATVCTDINIHIKAGLSSSYGVVKNDTWNFDTRTICHTSSVIGYSIGGRPIIADTFGSGAQVVLYVGNIHGNEKSTKYLMDAWIDELESNVRSIPSNKTIVVISTINPDGFAAGGRSNSNNVDLNRNFPTSDWQTDIIDPTHQSVPGGGGATALSEPESQALANYTLQLNPHLTMSFHSSAGYAIGNQSGNSADLATEYAGLTGYQDMTGNDTAFSYPITGTYDDWLREESGLISVVVELSSNTSSQFNINKAALWLMARS
ncbi:MAG: DUF2817 domain-containing protein [Candidatus Saccharibacteria bacterium]